MTKSGTKRGSADRAGRRCRWCRQVLPEQQGAGRPREFCSPACRQRDWVGRQSAPERRLDDDEVVVGRAELDALHDDLYVLSCALDDVDRDLQSSPRPSARELREALDWLREAAEPLRNRALVRRP